MQEEVTQKTIAFSIKSAKLTIQVLQAAARKFLETQNKGKTKLHHGQQSLKQLKKHGAALSNIEITDANIGLFKPCAKKYGVDFTLRKDATTQPPHYIVIPKRHLSQRFHRQGADLLRHSPGGFGGRHLCRNDGRGGKVCRLSVCVGRQLSQHQL